LHGRKYQHFLFLYSEKDEVIALKTEKYVITMLWRLKRKEIAGKGINESEGKGYGGVLRNVLPTYSDCIA
jgi:hypothetical protein